MKIDEAPAIATPSGTEVIPCSASGAAKRITARQIANLAPQKTNSEIIAAVFSGVSAQAAATDTLPARRSNGTPAVLTAAQIAALAPQKTDAQIAAAASSALYAPTTASSASATDKVPALRGSTKTVLTAGQIAALADIPTTQEIASAASNALYSPTTASSASASDKVPALRGSTQTVLTAGQIAALADIPTTQEIASAASSALYAPTPSSSASATDRLPALRDGSPVVVTAGDIAALADVPTAQDIASAASSAVYPSGDPLTSALGTDIMPLRRSGAAATLTLARLAAYVESVIDGTAPSGDTPGDAGLLTDADLVHLSQSGSEVLATLDALKAHILAGLVDHIAALGDSVTPSASAPPYGDHLLLVRTSTTAPALYRASLKDLAVLFSNRTVAGETLPGVAVHTETRSVAAQAGSVALDFTIPKGAILRALRLRVDETVSISHLAEDAADGTQPSDDTPAVKLHVLVSDYLGGVGLLENAGDVKSGVYTAPVSSAFTPSVSFLDAEATGNVYTYSGRVRASVTWEEPAPLDSITQED